MIQHLETWKFVLGMCQMIEKPDGPILPGFHVSRQFESLIYRDTQSAMQTVRNRLIAYQYLH